MKLFALILGIMLLAPACATVQHSESIDVDHFGATGSYRDTRGGTLTKIGFLGGGAGGGVGGGMGFLINSNQGQSDPRYFAQSVVMVDLSKKLKSIKVDEVEGIREYEYVQPMTRTDYKGAKPKSSLPSAFGHQPVQ